MEAKRLLHYRHGGKNTHVGCECLPDGKDITVVISGISFIEDEMVNGKKQDCWIAYFAKNPYFSLPMVLNSTNKKRLAKLAGTPYLETIKKLPVILTQELTKDPSGGDQIMGLRISQIRAKMPTQTPTEKIKLTVDHPKFDELKTWLKNPVNKFEKLLSVYEVDEETKTKLLTE